MRILSLDGGGYRGLLTARLLWRLNQACPGFLKHVDVIAGASTGGIQALHLASGGKPEDLMQLYLEHAPRIFKPRDWADAIPVRARLLAFAGLLGAAAVAGLFGQLSTAAVLCVCAVGAFALLTLISKLDEAARANYAAEDLEEVLKEILGEAVLLRDLEKPVIVPTFDMRDWAPRRVTNLPGDERWLDVRLWELARCTSAAPTYWPSYSWCLDGGLVANNPSAMAVSEVVKRVKHDLKCNHGLCDDEAVTVALARTSVLSIGTGEVPHQPPSERHDWDAGIVQTIPLLLDVIMDGAVKDDADTCSALLNGRHVRIQPRLPNVIALDDIGAAPELIRIADMTDLTPALELVRSWIKEDSAKLESGDCGHGPDSV